MLVVLSSTLLGVWAVKDTIAFRNILLVIGALLSVYYIVQEWRHGDLKKHSNIWKVLPFILLSLVFIWVIGHYLFLSLDPIKQFEELKSTWLRTSMAFLIGLATGIALRKHPNRLFLLSTGILISYLILFYQYIPRALERNSLLAPDYDHYLFHLKINIVLMGMILIACIDGALLDHLRAIDYCWKKLKLWYLLYWLLGSIGVFWAFVYIANARNGIGLSLILHGFWLICSLVFFIQNRKFCQSSKNLMTLLMPCVGFCLILYFANLQLAFTKSWYTLIDDAKIAVQIDRYPNWQDLDQMGFPKRDDGEVVATNTYERFAWATVGLNSIYNYPQGVGLLAYPLSHHPNTSLKLMPKSNITRTSTHSGWVELGLAFGIPILILIFGALLLTFIEAARHTYPGRMSVFGFTVMIASMYTVGEVTIKHGIEILFFLLALLPALLLTNSCKKCY